MKLIKVLALTLCVAAFATGCACCGKKSTCGMACCADGKTDCASCATCTPKK
jgi:hypothetical protein